MERCQTETLLGPTLMSSEGLSVMNDVYLGLHAVKAAQTS